MDIGVVSMRYAKALIEYAKENRAEDTLYKEMKMLSRNLSASELERSPVKSCAEYP